VAEVSVVSVGIIVRNHGVGSIRFARLAGQMGHFYCDSNLRI